MDPLTIILVVIIALLLLLAMEMPVAYALAIVGSLGLVLLHSFSYAHSVLGSAPFVQTFRFTLTVIPTFILIGILAVHGRIAEQVFRISNHIFRRVPGGLGAATVMACAGFAAVTGSSVAVTATVARLSVGEMRKYGYPASFAAGLVASAGTIGVMIPPSIILVLYSVITGESTGRMLAAGIVPGLITAASYIVYALVRGRKLVPKEAALRVAAGRSASAVTGEAESDSHAEEARQDRLRDLPWRGVVRIAIIFMIVIGGIYSGFFTATESGAIGALVALVFLMLELRKDGWRVIRSRLAEALRECASTTSMIFAIVIGSSIFAAFLVTSRAPQALSDWVGGLDVAPHVVVAIFLLLLIPLGLGLESIAILIIAMPLMYPVVTDLGFDGIWFGILAVKLIEIGLVTPPVGISCFVAASAGKVRLEQVFRGIWPFVVIDLGIVAVLFSFPEVVLWLPNLVQT